MNINKERTIYIEWLTNAYEAKMTNNINSVIFKQLELFQKGI